ncbi:MAG TPA: FecR domain-containing protein, partial [Pyrinomonadaceae bacterium]
MKQITLRLLSFAALCIFSVSFVSAQDNRVASAVSDMYVISAKAGGVNFVEGKVAVARKNAKSGLLLKGDNVEIGERVVTGENGKAEILLNPGSFLRLDKNSSFQFVSTDLENLKLVLTGGSAILEVFADEEYKVTVRTPKAAFYLIDSGVYRVNVLPDGTEQIEVWKGKAAIGDANATVVKGGKTATIKNGQLGIAKFDRDEKDEFDSWSKLRAKDLAKINANLQKRQLRDSLLNSYNQQGWNVYDSFGVWAYNSFYGSYCFVPFGYGWSSPY